MNGSSNCFGSQITGWMNLRVITNIDIEIDINECRSKPPNRVLMKIVSIDPIKKIAIRRFIEYPNPSSI